MERKDHLDLFGAASLTFFAGLLAFNQVVIKFATGGFGPVFAAGLRSALAAGVIVLWMAVRRIPFVTTRDVVGPGIIVGLLFSFEFMMLFAALDLTSVSRVSVIFYSMPVWMAIAAHFLLPGETLNRRRITGLVLAMAGVMVALSDRAGGTASLAGDLLALFAAFCWAGIALTIRLTPLVGTKPETQLLYQLIVSAMVLLALAPLFGPMLRDPQPIHYAAMGFQAVAIASLGFLFWFFLLSVYPASSVASFSFLSPVLSVVFGWWLLNEQIGPAIWLALALVAAGLVLINRRS